ncbi:DgyrCDS7462 [Dimorphilus gyrociliatus]|uniref:DgyrCDS7462 n=1 Tax=Dimorphilus gyrociliatus TaxID=2664684 RepID=A0A7I8VSS9_9ANNE|nr:DgyrCDS7462 [Dimorphilus gyrociliatus]
MPTVLRAKCLIVGDSTVGKSAITQVFHSDGTHFPKTYSMTTNIELVTKPVQIPESHDQVEMFLFDNAGKEVFCDQVMKHWSNPSLLMLVYDVTSETSFSSCSKWLSRVQSIKSHGTVPGVLVANKVDLTERRIISTKEGEEFANNNKLDYFEVSAKSMENVEQPFIHLCKRYYELYREKIEHFENLGCSV